MSPHLHFSSKRFGQVTEGEGVQPGWGCSWTDREKGVDGAVQRTGSAMVTVKVHWVNSKFTQAKFLSENINGNCQFDICLIIQLFRSFRVGQFMHQHSLQVGVVVLELKICCLPARCHFLYYLFVLVSKLKIVLF